MEVSVEVLLSGLLVVVEVEVDCGWYDMVKMVIEGVLVGLSKPESSGLPMESPTSNVDWGAFYWNITELTSNSGKLVPRRARDK